MARKKTTKPSQKDISEKTEDNREKRNLLGDIKRETKYSIFALLSLVFGLVFVFSFLNKAGVAGIYINKTFNILFGKGAFIVPIIFFFLSVLFFYSIRPNLVRHALIGSFLLLFSSLGVISTTLGAKEGGYAGYLMSLPLMKFFDFYVSLIVLTAMAFVSILLMVNMPISFSFLKKKLIMGKSGDGNDDAEISISNGAPVEDEGGDQDQKEKLSDKIRKTLPGKNQKTSPEKDEENSDEEIPDINTKPSRHKNNIGFIPPPLEILEGDKGKPSSGDIKANANIIKRTLQNFGIDVEMAEINIGPSVTQYTLKPAEGIKLSRIIALQNDLALALAAHPLRIEAPIPGRSLVGIEIPNSAKTIIGLASLFKEDGYRDAKHLLLVAMGRDVAGRAVFANIAKMPHLLVAGATGSGKSIYIHTLITSLLYRNSPETLRFIMIDPKRVELTIYNNIPHMLTPVITETKKAIMILKWLCKEMERRYEKLLSAGVRDIGSYHDKKNEDASMPYLAVIIDELADLMATYPREMEASIVRLAQMSRAVGIHLILSTQRPSVEVITGLIKANITSRVALQVASQIDSRTIIDMAGAEKLLGHGDMLYLAGDTAKPKRIQGPFISEKEVKRIVDYLADQYKNVDFDEISPATEQGGDGVKTQSSFEINFEENDEKDELYEEARKTVMETGKASTSFLQRKLKIGYARAARLVDMLEERGVVGPGDGARARQVFASNGNTDALEQEMNRLLGENNANIKNEQ